MGGTEYYKMKPGRLETSNSGISVIIGNRAGTNDDLTNNENIYLGYFAGDQNVSSAANIGIGRAAQEKHTSGNFTIAIGNYSLQKHTTGSNNVALGAYAANNLLDGEGNLALGTGAMRFDTAGNNNVSIGSFCLYNGTEMSGNVAIGNNAGYNANGDNNVYLGKSAGYNASGNNKLYIDNTNTSSPLIYGEFNNNLLRVNGTLNSTGEISGDAGLDITTTAVVGDISLGSESTDQGTSNFASDGYTTTAWLYTNAIEAANERGSASTLITIGNDGTYGGDDQIHFVTSGNSQMMVNSNGRVGIDKSSPASDLHIRQSQQSITGGTGGITFEDGSDATDFWRIYHSGIYFSFNKGSDRVAYINSTGAWTVDSDRSFKKNIGEMRPVLNRVMQLRPVQYHYKEQSENEQKTPGFIAQELQPLFPEVVVRSEEDKLGVSYGQMTPIALKAIQEQQVIIESLKTENADLLQKINDLDTRLSELENR